MSHSDSASEMVETVSSFRKISYQGLLMMSDVCHLQLLLHPLKLKMPVFGGLHACIPIMHCGLSSLHPLTRYLIWCKQRFHQFYHGSDLSEHCLGITYYGNPSLVLPEKITIHVLCRSFGVRLSGTLIQMSLVLCDSWQVTRLSVPLFFQFSIKDPNNKYSHSIVTRMKRNAFKIYCLTYGYRSTNAV